MDMAAMRKMMEESSKEERDKGMAEWGEWMKNNMSKFADGGAPTGKNWHVTPEGSSQISNDVGGYSMVMAQSAEEAAKFLEGSPHLKMPGATIDLAEIVPMGM